MIYSYQENSTMRCIKYAIITFCFLFMLTGMVMVILGSTISTLYHDYNFFLEAKFFSPSALVVAIGFITIGVSLMGCIGALRESVFLIMMFSGSLGVIFILEITASIVGYVMMNEIGDFLRNMLVATMEQYTVNSDAKNIMDVLQSSLGCCGVTGPNDWVRMSYPSSCYASAMDIYAEGCLTYMEFTLKQSGIILASSALLLAYVQFTGMILAYRLATRMRQEKSAREHRRWVLREELMKNADLHFTSMEKMKPGFTSTVYTSPPSYANVPLDQE